jgi:hypothetical protein
MMFLNTVRFEIINISFIYIIIYYS